MFSALAKRLRSAEILWDTAIVGTPNAQRYELLRYKLVDYIYKHRGNKTMMAWLSEQADDHTNDILAEVEDRVRSEEEEDSLSTYRRIQRECECNSYALTRKFKWVPKFNSEKDKREWIDSFINSAWDAAPGYRVIVDFRKHQEAFGWLRAKHNFPDLIEVIGPPLAEHHLPDGSLTIQRKRELLLLGLFYWRGFTITYRRWHFIPSRNAYWSRPAVKQSWQWVVAVACVYPPVEIDEAIALLSPPCAYIWRTFRPAILKWGIKAGSKRSKGVHRLPRRVICVYCGKSFVSSETKRLNYQGRPRRFCNEHAELLLKTNALRSKRSFRR